MSAKKKIKIKGLGAMISTFLILVAVIVLALFGVSEANQNKIIEAVIDYADEAVEAEVDVEVEAETETGQGAIETEEIPTVESVDAGSPVVDTSVEEECPEGEECGQGATTVDVSSPTAFKNATLGGCWNMDGYYGAQCWDLADLFWVSYVGRTLTTCGTGAAKGTIADGCYQKNAGSEFTMIWDATELQAGDWVVFNTGTWGHIGMAMGSYNDGYITLLGQNQGGNACAGGGSSTNIINISLKDFAGAFRPNSYIVPEPEPEPEPTPEPEDEYIYYTVKTGDTLGGILYGLGYTGTKMFGDDGFAQAVATENGIANRGLIFPNQTIKVKKAEF